MALCGSVVYTLVLLYLKGYFLLASLLAPLTVLLLWKSRREAYSGVVLCGHQGEWSINQGDERTPIRIGARSSTLPWVIYLALREFPEGRCGHLWLFSDSADEEQLRQLRVQLSLQHRA
jgi:hypothetical protein